MSERGLAAGRGELMFPLLVLLCPLFFLLKLVFDLPERRRRTTKWSRSLQILGKFHYSC
jgi:hypothetical protein